MSKSKVNHKEREQKEEREKRKQPPE